LVTLIVVRRDALNRCSSRLWAAEKDYSYNIAKLSGFGHTFETPTAFASDGSVRYAALVANLLTPARFSHRPAILRETNSPSDLGLNLSERVALAINNKGRAYLMINPQRIGTDLGEKKILADINECGWHCTNVVEDDGHTPWTFTIGLYETWQNPELIIIGRSRATANEMLTAVATEIEENRVPTSPIPTPTFY
jgi:hypothetical protein